MSTCFFSALGRYSAVKAIFFLDDGPYKYRSIWKDHVFCCFGNIKTLDQALVELEQLRI